MELYTCDGDHHRHAETRSAGSVGDLREDGIAPAEAKELLDEVRRELMVNPDTAYLAVARLLRLVTPRVIQPDVARGGLAPWQTGKIDRYLRAHLLSPLPLDGLAKQVSLSVSHFCRAFKESFGTSPHMYIISLRLALAQQLMLTTQDPLSQIALACGLADQAHLSKLFRRMIGVTPSVWRRRHLTEDQAAAGLVRATADHGHAASQRRS